MRKASARPARRGGGWWHSFTLNPLPSTARPAPQPRTTPARADADHVDHVLRALIGEHLSLSSRHRDSLLARGLTLEAVERNGYKSAPTHRRAAEISSALSHLSLDGVPGFYREGGAWHMAVTSPGFYVPVRDERGRISALQLRRDSGSPKYLWLSSASRPCGATSGAPPHFAGVAAPEEIDELLITEGALKADVISCLSKTAVVGLAGVQAFGDDFAPRLRTSFPCLRRAVIAYDRDWREKPQVKAALRRLLRSLTDGGLRATVRAWPSPEKGLDDYLLALLVRKGGVAA